MKINLDFIKIKFIKSCGFTRVFGGLTLLVVAALANSNTLSPRSEYYKDTKEPSTTETTPIISKEDHEKSMKALERIHQRLDSQLLYPRQETPWTPPDDTLITIQHMKNELKITKINCSHDFCSYEIQCMTDETAKSVPLELSVEGTIFYRYFNNDSKKIIAYIFREGVNIEKYITDY